MSERIAQHRPEADLLQSLRGSLICWLCALLGLLAPGGALAETRPFVGVIVAAQQVDVTSEVEGRLMALAVRLGDRVKGGQILASIDSRTLSEEAEASSAAVRSAQAQLARSVVRRSQAEERLKRLELARQFIAEEQLHAAAEDLEIARADELIAEAEAAQARSHHSIAAANLEEATVRAPFDGEVSLVHVSSGALLRPGQVLLRIIGSELRLRFAVPPEAISSIRLGSAVKLSGAQFGERHIAVVDAISPEIDVASRHVFVEAAFRPSFSLQDVRVGQMVNVKPTADVR